MRKHHRRTQYVISITIFFVLLFSIPRFTLNRVQASTPTASIEVKLKKGEKWWGGAVDDGKIMPYQTGYSYEMYGDNKGNQVQPLLISNQGRVIWSEEPFKFTFTENNILLAGRGEIQQSQAAFSLRKAFQYAAKNYFPPNGKIPDELLFTAPQYNTWIELARNQNQLDILEYAHNIIDNDFPPGVLMIDNYWQEDHGRWDFHPGRFPDPKAMVEELHELGFKVMLWVSPFVSADSSVYRQLAEQDLLLKNPKGIEIANTPWRGNNQPATIYWWDGASALLDLSNPVAEKWFKGALQRLVNEYDVDGYKLDAGDTRFYPDYLVSYQEDITPNEHTALFGKLGLDYSLNEYRAMWKMAGLPLVQRLRDKGHNWEDLQSLIPNITTQGLIGYAFTCPDMIGGGALGSFEDLETIDRELIVRSAQTHALMPMMQFSVAPWRILDEVHLQAVKDAVSLRDRFIPRIMELAEEAAKTGEPIVRTMEYVFPNQGYADIKDQFLLGDDILVAPILNKGVTQKTVILPKGIWMDANGKKLNGKRSLNIKVSLDTLPYFTKIS